MPKSSLLIVGFLVASIFFVSHFSPPTSSPSAPLSLPPTASHSPVISVEESPGVNQDVSYEFTATASGTPALDLVLAHVEVKTQAQAGEPTIIGINGLKANEEYSWQCYLNDRPVSSTTLSYLRLDEGDKLRFSFEN